MVPKLTAFYRKCLLPELAAPRVKTMSGVREPEKPWFTSRVVRAKPKGRQKTKNSCMNDTRESDSEHDEAANTDTGTALNSVDGKSSGTCNRQSSRYRRSKFVGRSILHQWCTNEATNTLEWYEGTVLECVKGTDGCKGATYEVKYKLEKERYLVDHLQEDLDSGSLKFVDI